MRREEPTATSAVGMRKVVLRREGCEAATGTDMPNQHLARDAIPHAERCLSRIPHDAIVSKDEGADRLQVQSLHPGHLLWSFKVNYERRRSDLTLM